MDSKNSFLGKGWSFPPKFDEINKEVVMVNREFDIEESLHILLSTRPGDRIYNEKFGCDLDQFLFAEVSETLFAHMREVITDAIVKFEARVDVEEIQIEYENEPNEQAIMHIDVIYTIRQTNSRHNVVFPFYFIEGNNVSE